MLNRRKFFITLNFIFAVLLLAFGIQFCIAGKLAFATCEFLLAAFEVISGYLGLREYKRLKALHNQYRREKK